MIPIYTYSTESGHLSTAAATVEAATAAPRPAETPTSNPILLTNLFRALLWFGKHLETTDRANEDNRS